MDQVIENKMIEIIPAKTIKEMSIAFNIRTRVFVDEQNVPVDIEMDEFDQTSEHILCYFNDKPVGTARFRQTSEGYKLERFAVLKEYRNSGVGKALLEYCLKNLPDESNIYLYSQEQVMGFYNKYGFIQKGRRFYEAEIPHMKMVYNKNIKSK